MADFVANRKPRKSEPIRNAGRRGSRPRTIELDESPVAERSSKPSPSRPLRRQNVRRPRMSTPSGRDRSELRRPPRHNFRENISLNASDSSISEMSDVVVSSERSRQYSYREIRKAKQRMEQYKNKDDPVISDRLRRECDTDKRRYLEKVKSRDPSRSEDDFETRLDELLRRQRDIDRGRSAEIYEEYINEIAKVERETHHPRTPNKFRKVSRRAWDGMIKKWRKTLYNFRSLDPEEPYRSEMSVMGSDEETDDVLSSPWSVARQSVPDAEEETLKSGNREKTGGTSAADDDTLDAHVPRINLRERRALSARNRIEPAADVLHSGLTNDINAISMGKKTTDQEAIQDVRKRRSSSRKK